MRVYKFADVAELADALDSGSSESNFMWVQVPSSAPKLHTYFDTNGIDIGVQFNFCKKTICKAFHIYFYENRLYSS